MMFHKLVAMILMYLILDNYVGINVMTMNKSQRLLSDITNEPNSSRQVMAHKNFNNDSSTYNSFPSSSSTFVDQSNLYIEHLSNVTSVYQDAENKGILTFIF